MNIHCLFDLFAGMLHDKNIPVYFTIERYNTITGDVLETSPFSDKGKFEANPNNSVVLEISDTESICAILKMTPGVVLGNMSGILIITSLKPFNSIKRKIPFCTHYASMKVML